MSWPFLAVFFSGWLFVDASYRGPRWQRWVFKPVTLLLLLLLAWQAPVLSAAGYLIVLGLLATLIGDALLLLPRERVLYAIGAFFLSHLLYTLSFASQMTFSLFWPLPLALLAIGALLLAALWTRLEEMRWPIVTYVAMTLLMVWLAGEQYFLRSTDFGFSLLTGTAAAAGQRGLAAQPLPLHLPRGGRHRGFLLLLRPLPDRAFALPVETCRGFGAPNPFLHQASAFNVRASPAPS